MARPREFDKAEVVAQAAELFRLKGYQATSMRDLIAHVGLSSSSIYAAFGGKYGLFMAALEHGAARDAALIANALEHPDGVLAGIAALYQGLIDRLLAEEGATASLTLRAALENLDARGGEVGQDAVRDASGGRGAARDAVAERGGSLPSARPDVIDALRTHFAGLSAVVEERLARAEASGELRLNQAPSDLALFILLNAFNLTFVVKLTHDRDRLAAYVQAALDAVAGDGGRAVRGARTGA